MKLVVVIRGLYATEHQLSRLPDALSDTRVTFVDTQGVGTTIEALVRHYEAAFAEFEEFVVIGVSLGGLVALGLRCKGLIGVLALDPPIRPSDDQILAQQCLVRGDPLATALLPDRDYLPLIDPPCITVVLAGEHGAISDDTLANANRRGVRVVRVPGVGHDITRGASDLVLAEVQDLLGAKPQQLDEHPPLPTCSSDRTRAGPSGSTAS